MKKASVGLSKKLHKLLMTYKGGGILLLGWFGNHSSKEKAVNNIWTGDRGFVGCDEHDLDSITSVSMIWITTVSEHAHKKRQIWCLVVAATGHYLDGVTHVSSIWIGQKLRYRWTSDGILELHCISLGFQAMDELISHGKDGWLQQNRASCDWARTGRFDNDNNTRGFHGTKKGFS